MNIKRIQPIRLGAYLCVGLPIALCSTYVNSIEYKLTLGHGIIDKQTSSIINPLNVIVDATPKRSSIAQLNLSYLGFSGGWEFDFSSRLDYEYQSGLVLIDSPDNSASTSDIIVSNASAKWLKNDSTEVLLGFVNHLSGASYAWNPSNVFFDIRTNEKDSAREFLKNGDLTLQITHYLDDGFWQFKLVQHEPFPKTAAGKKTIALVTRQLLLDSSELELNVASDGGHWFVSGNYSNTLNDQLEFHTELALKPQSQVQDLAISQIFNQEDSISSHSSNYLSAVIGIQYTYENLTNLIVEYYYQEEGYNETQWQKLQTLVTEKNNLFLTTFDPNSARILGDTHHLLRRLRQQYLFARVSIPDFLSYGNFSIYNRYNIDDDSYTYGGAYELNISESSSIHLSTQMSNGETFSESRWVPIKKRFDITFTYLF